MLDLMERARTSRGRWMLLACGVLLAACTEDDGNDGGVALCDIRAAACQRSIFASTAQLRGQSGEGLPPVRMRTLAQIEAEFRSGSTPEVNQQEGAWWRALALLRLVPPGQEPDEVSLQVFLDNVAAYYDPSNKQITIIDRGSTGDTTQGTYVLAHEFVHALQDRDINLGAFSERWVTSTDSSVAVSALIEGEATLLSNVLLTRARGYELYDVDWRSYHEQGLTSVFISLNQNEAPLLAASRLLPYPVGTAYLVERYRSQGMAAVTELYAKPPLSLLEWTSGAFAQPSASPEPLECFPTTAPAGYRGLDHDALGQVGVFAAQTLSGDPDWAWQESQNTRGDSMVLFVQEGELNESTPIALVWRVVFDTENHAVRFASTVRELGPVVRVETVSDREVLIRAATDPSILGAWTIGCGPAEELPRPPETQELRVASRLQRLLRSRKRDAD